MFTPRETPLFDKIYLRGITDYGLLSCEVENNDGYRVWSSCSWGVRTCWWLTWRLIQRRSSLMLCCEGAMGREVHLEASLASGTAYTRKKVRQG